MSDWSIYELEDIVWDKFGSSDDHIVPHPGRQSSTECLQKGECHKKFRPEAASTVSGIASKTVFQEHEKANFQSTVEDDTAPTVENDSFSWSHPQDFSFPASEPGCINLANRFAPVDAKDSNSCFSSGNGGSGAADFCADNTTLGNGDGVADDSLCDFHLDDISAAESDLEFFRNGTDRKDNSDLLDYGWPDIGNFEDVDRMFRSCDSTFGQGNTGPIGEFSWFSNSSFANEVSGDTYKTDFIKSCPEVEVSNSRSEYHETDQKFVLPCGHHPTSVCDHKRASDVNNHCAYDNCFDADSKTKQEQSLDQAPGSEDSQLKLPPQTTSHANSVAERKASEVESIQREYSKGHHIEGKRKIHSSEYLTGSLPCSDPLHQLSDLEIPPMQCSSQVLSQQRQPWEADSYGPLHSYCPYGHQDYRDLSHHFQVSSTVSSIKSETKNYALSCKALSGTSNNGKTAEMPANAVSKLSTVTPEEKVKSFHYPQKIQATVMNENHVDQCMSDAKLNNQLLAQKQLNQIQDEVEGDNEVEFAGTDIDSTLHENSSMSSVLSNDISLEATSFRQLQEVMEQLDVKTKLCIRDSLYRLARSAEQRRNFCRPNSCNRDRRGGSGALATEPKHEPPQCLEFMDPETETNSIDRSIAQLLFHRPPGPSERLSNDSLSLESHAAIYGSTKQAAMQGQLVNHEDITGDSEMLSITKL